MVFLSVSFSNRHTHVVLFLSLSLSLSCTHTSLILSLSNRQAHTVPSLFLSLSLSLFHTYTHTECWEVALEVMEVLHAAGIVQPDHTAVVGRLWRLLLDKAWDSKVHVDDKWACVEHTLTDVGRRYVDKPDLLPLNEVVEWLEKQVSENLQGPGEERVVQILREMEVEMLKLIRVYTQLHDGALRHKTRQDKYFKTLIGLYQTYFDEKIQSDGNVPLPLAALETDLNRLEIRNPNGADDLKKVRAKFLLLRDQRRQNGFL